MILATLLFLVSAALLGVLTFPRQRLGPEGPVGFHMITAPLALAQSVAVGLAGSSEAFAASGLPAWPLFVALLGHFVALVLLPVFALDQRRGWMARGGVAVALLGAAAVLYGPSLPAGAVAVAASGLAAVGAVALFGYGVLLAWYAQTARNRIAAATASVERQESFERDQAQWQLGEWRKLPPEPALWQLIQFTHAFHPEVREQCRARVVAMPDIAASTVELLGTGWAEHSLHFLRDVYPGSTATIAPAVATLLEAQCERWRKTLADGGNPGSWYANLATYLDVAERVAGDGGDVREPMAKWATMLRGKRGLEPLASRARALADGAVAAAAP